MIEQLRQLYEVQKIDTQIGQLKAELAALDDGASLRIALKDCLGRLGDEEEALKAVERELRDAELQLKSTEDKRKVARDKLYSGTIMNPKELQDYQQEIASLTVKKGDLEERGLLLMDQVEEQRAQVTALEQEAERVRQRLAQVEARHREETARREAALAELATARETACAPIDPSFLRRYEQTRDRPGNTGIVRIDGDLCPACHTQIPSATLKRARDPRATALCDSCNRLLYCPAAEAPTGAVEDEGELDTDTPEAER